MHGDDDDEAPEEQYEISLWAERGSSSIVMNHLGTGRTVFSLADDDVESAFENGFLRGGFGNVGRDALRASFRAYADHLGVVAEFERGLAREREAERELPL